MLIVDFGLCRNHPFRERGMVLKFRRIKRKKGTVAVSLLIMMAIAVGIIGYIWCYQRETNFESAHHLVMGEKNKLQYAIDSRILVTDILEANLMSHDGKVVDFNEMASLLYTGDPSIRSIELAPDGVVTYVYPLKGNENAFIDLFEEPNQKEEAELARDSGQTTLAGPFELVQGGLGLVARNPVYITKDDGQREFWGFSTVVFNVPDIFKVVNLDLLTGQNYYYRLWRTLPGSDEVQVITENTNRELNGAIRGEVTVPNGVWYLDVKPQDGWVSMRMIVALTFVLMIFVVFTTLLLSAYLTVLDQGDELVRQNDTDALTGIKNSRYLMKRIRKFAVSKTPFVLFYLEMNNFKEIRDKYGRGEADNVLVEMAGRIGNSIRNTDTVARFDGDEFAIILLNNDTEEYCAVLRERIRQSVSQIYRIEDDEFYPLVRVGFARYPADAPEVDQVIRIADQRMQMEVPGEASEEE